MDDRHDEKPDDTDDMDITLPIGGWFRVRGKNTSKLFKAVSIGIIILTIGLAIRLVLDGLIK